MAGSSEILQAFRNSGQKFETDTISIQGEEITVVFFSHASLAFVWDGKVIYNDPLMEYADYGKLPAADLITVSHEHYDHLDKTALDALAKSGTLILGSRAVAEAYPQAKALAPGDHYRISDNFMVRITAAYNVSPDQLQFHPRERGDNGYILELGGARIYIAGDTEPIPEMKSLGRIDVMFLPVNQPYTMTPQQAAEAAMTIGAPIFYPYHTTDTDLRQFEQLLGDRPDISVRIYDMP